MKRKSEHFLMKSLALALALLLTLGNLPFVSFAEGVGMTGEANPINPQAADPKYVYDKAQFYIATGNVEDPLNYVLKNGMSGGFWPEQSRPIKGEISSDSLDFIDESKMKLNTHYIATDSMFNDVKMKIKYDYTGNTANQETSLFEKQDINNDNVKQAFISELKRIEKDQPFVLTDQERRKVHIKPDDLSKPGFKLEIFRFIRFDKKLHVDILLVRPLAQPIIVEEVYVDQSGVNKTVTYDKINFGTELGKPKTHEIVSIEIWDEAKGEYVETSGPVIFDDKAKKVRVNYRANMSEGIQVIPYHLEGYEPISSGSDKNITDEMNNKYKFTDFIKDAIIAPKPVEIGIPTNEKITIQAPKVVDEKLEIQKVSLYHDDKLVKDSIDSLDEVYEVGHVYKKKVELRVYYKIKQVKLDVVIVNEKGEEVRVSGDYFTTLGEAFDVDQILNGENLLSENEYLGMKLHENEGEILSGKKIPADQVTKDLRKVYLFVNKKQTDGNIVVKPATLDGEAFPEGAYDLTEIKYPSIKDVPQEVTIPEPKGLLIDKVMNGSDEIKPVGGKYEVTNPEAGDLVLKVHYKKHMSQISVITEKDGITDSSKNISGQVGEEFKPEPIEGYDFKIFVETAVSGVYEEVSKVIFEGHSQNVKVVYTKKTDNGGDNGGNNNNNNNNDNGGNNNPGSDNNNPGVDNNNNNNNNDDTDNRDRYEYQEYNPDKENVIIKDDKAPLGQLNTDSYYAYIQGYPDGSVRPGAYVSRQETAAIFFRLLNPSYRETIRTDENSFSDVDKNTWSNKHISTLAKGGIIVGYEDGTFKPKQIITRAELISIASKFDKLDGNANHNFKDIAGHWAEKQIAAAAQKGTISGYLNGEFAPDKPVTRAEFAKIVNKVLKRNVKKEEVLPGVKQFTDLQSDMWYYEDMVTATNSYNATRGDDGYQKWTELIKIFIEM